VELKELGIRIDCTLPVRVGRHLDGADFTVALNGQVVNRFHFAGDPQSPRRGLPSTAAEPRFIGLQTHTGRVLFRHIQWRAL
jgi:3-keto-disaccharide hydrolase